MDETPRQPASTEGPTFLDDILTLVRLGWSIRIEPADGIDKCFIVLVFLQPPRETSRAPAYREFNLYYSPEEMAEWVHAVKSDVVGNGTVVETPER